MLSFEKRGFVLFCLDGVANCSSSLLKTLKYLEKKPEL